MTLTPEQIKDIIIAALLVAAMAFCGFTGWKINGWRLAGQIEQLEGDKKILQGQIDVLAGGLKACNAGVDAAKSAGDQVRGLLGTLFTEVRKKNEPNNEAIARIEDLLKQPTPAGAGCDAAWALLELQRKARGPQ